MEKEPVISTVEVLSEEARKLGNNFVPFFSEKLALVPQELFALSEQELTAKIHVGQADYQIRKRIHKLNKQHVELGDERLIEMVLLYDGVCTRQNFHHLIKNPYRLALWVMPILDVKELIDESLYFLLKRVRNEILTMPVNEKSAGHILKALEWFANRSSLGPVVQQIHQKSLNVNVNGGDSMRTIAEMDPEQLMERHRQLRTQLGAMPIEGTIVEDPE